VGTVDMFTATPAVDWASPEIVEAFLCCGRLVRSKSLVLDR
jgi:hypothetical protein